MKTIAASLIALGLLAGAANAAPQSAFSDLNASAPRSAFTDLSNTAPRSAFDQLGDTAPRSIFDEIRETAPRSGGKGLFTRLQHAAP